MILSSVQNTGWLMIINYTYDIQMLHFLLFRQKHTFSGKRREIIVFCSELDFDGILETCKYQRKCTRVNHI